MTLAFGDTNSTVVIVSPASKEVGHPRSTNGRDALDASVARQVPQIHVPRDSCRLCPENFFVDAGVFLVGSFDGPMLFDRPPSICTQSTGQLRVGEESSQGIV